MKNINYLISVALLLSVLTTTAQKGSNYAKFGIGTNLPISQAGKYNAGLSVAATNYIGIKQKENLLVSIGYTTNAYNTNTKFKASFVSTTVGYQVMAAHQVYFQPQVGAVFAVGDYYKSKSGIAYGIGVGKLFGSSQKGRFDASANIMSNSFKFTAVSINIGYLFKVK